MAEVRDVLNAAADLVEPEGAWTTRVVAKDRGGRFVSPEARRARCWCGIGAIMRVAAKAGGGMTEALACQAAHNEAKSRGFSSFGSFNDAPGRTQAEVVAALRSAAQSAGAEG